MKRSSKNFAPMIFTVSLFVLFVLHVAVLSPAAFRVNNDVMYSEGYLPMVFEIALQLTYLSCYIILFSFIALAVLRGGAPAGARYFLIFLCLTLLRYALNIFCSYMYEGGIPSSGDVIMTDALDGLFAFVLDSAQAAFCLWMCSWRIKKAEARYEAAQRWAEKHGDKSRAEEYNTLKWGKVFGLSNPIQLSLFLSASLIALIKIGSRLIYDISLAGIEGAPETAEIPLMAAYYISDIIFGLLIYVGCVAVLGAAVDKGNGNKVN